MEAEALAELADAIGRPEAAMLKQKVRRARAPSAERELSGGS